MGKTNTKTRSTYKPRPIAEILAELMASRTEFGEHGISQYRLEEITGVTQSTIQRILSGESREPRTSTIQPLADFFSVSVAQLRGEMPISDKEIGEAQKASMGEMVALANRALDAAGIPADSPIRKAPYYGELLQALHALDGDEDTVTNLIRVLTISAVK